jgi:PAS domain S-box-containing protein
MSAKGQGSMQDRTGVDIIPEPDSAGSTTSDTPGDALGHLRAIAALRESEEQFRMLAENLPGLCWIGDENGVLRWANKQWRDLFGGTSAEQGDPSDICHPDDLPLALSSWKQAWDEGETSTIVLRMRQPDGTYRPFLSKAVPIRDASGTVVRWCGVQIDFSDKQAHDRRQTVLRSFYDQSRDLTDPAAILTALAGILAEHLGTPHMLYGETADGDAETLDVFHAANGVPQDGAAARYGLNQAFASLAERYDWDESRVVEDNHTLGRDAADPVQRAADLMGVRSSINVPIVKEGRPVAMLAVLDTGVRPWSRDEIELCEELAERVWANLSRARAEAALLERERNQAFLLAWTDLVRGQASPDAIMATTLEALGRHMGVTRATFSESDASGRLFAILGEWRHEVISIAGTSFSLDEVGDTVEREWVAGAIVRYDDVTADPRIGAASISSYLAAEITAFVSIPLIESGKVRSALSVQNSAPRHWRESEVQLLRDVAERVWVMLERARAEAELLERERHQAFLIDWSDAVRGQASPDAIIATTLEWLGRHLGATRTTYAETDATGRMFTVTGEWRDGVSSIRGNSFLLESVGAAVDREWTAGEIIRYEDVATDPRLEPAAIARYQGADIQAFVSVPLVQGGRMHSALSVQHNAPRRWPDGEIQLMRDIAERTWVALERAHAQAALQERERNQAFLLAWSDRIRQQTSARDILAQTLAALGEHLGAMRTNFAETEDDGTTLCVLQEWTTGLPSIVNQRYPSAALGTKLAAAHMSGLPVRVNDVSTDPRFDEQNRPLFDSLQIAAVLTLPMMRAGQIVAVLSVQQDTPRVWTDSDVDLVRDLADRTLAVLERAHSEERLAESEAQLSAFLENAPVAMHLKNGEGRYIRVNPEFAKALGRTPEELHGAHTDEIFPPDIRAELDRLEQLAQNGQVASAEIAFNGMGDVAHVLSMVFPITGAGVARTGGFTLDLTERKRAEADLARSREALYQTEKLSALGSLLAGVSHELNNPLSIVVAQAVMMERQSRGGELAERAQKIRRAADRCARIVQTFLAMARQKRPEREPVDLNAVAMAAYDLAEYGLRNDGIAASRDLAPSLPNISADSDQLHQIIINLIVNAQQALVEAGVPDRALTVRTAIGADPGTVILDVADNGPGIPEEARRRVFEPFFTTKPQGQGTGVGLSFSQGLAEAHGGTLELVPMARGACFRLTLPIDAEPALPAAEIEPPVVIDAPARKALVVDDEQEIAESLADFLSIEGFACDIAVGGAAAQARLTQGYYDLVISDLRMPGMDGPQLYAWIAAERPDLVDRVAFATGDTLGAAAARFLDAVKRPVLEKPFMPDAVHRFLQQMDLA